MTDATPLTPPAPLISVVLPVGGVEEFLPACLDSVLGPDRPAGQAGLEVIAVDDASPDGCGRILDDRAAADPRLRVIHLAESVGPGPARMRGLGEAVGAYVWFVDPDDLLADGALAAVTARLARDRPDLLLVDYLILRGPGRADPSPGAALLAAPPAPGAAAAATLTLAERPALVDRTMTVWSKVFRREFLVGLGVCFPPGIHEDVPVSAAALLSAQRIALLDRVCYLYRRRRRSFLATASMGHFSVFASYESVFALMDGAAGGAAGAGPLPVSAPVRAAVFGRAIEHYSTVLASGRVPRGARREFFHRMAADYRRYRPAGYRRPPGVRGMKFTLIERDAYGAYLLLAPLNNARVAVTRARRARPRGSAVAARS